MANVSKLQAIKLVGRGINNYIAERPLVVAYEVTLSCNCNCRHCDLGGFIKDEKQIKPEEYGNVTRRLRPVVAIFSGGETLLRKDMAAIVKAIKQYDGTPYLILASNGVLLNESNYLQLREAGVNQFSISFDFPDERHDEFRGWPGLYKHLEQTLPRLAKLGFRDIILNTAITKANLGEILPLAILRQAINELVALRKRDNHIANPKSVLLNTLKFFEQGCLPDCKAGIRFLVVMPDGSLIPCSLHRSKYATQKEMVEKFSRTNQCSSCYLSLRSYSELSVLNQMKNIPYYAKRLFA
jgi:MoaA/NifB/PqqE/SkfB family radical SAM enzyme